MATAAPVAFGFTVAVVAIAVTVYATRQPETGQVVALAVLIAAGAFAGAGETSSVRAEELPADEVAAFWPRVLRMAPDYARCRRRTNRHIPLIRMRPAG